MTESVLLIELSNENIRLRAELAEQKQAYSDLAHCYIALPNLFKDEVKWDDESLTKMRATVLHFTEMFLKYEAEYDSIRAKLAEAHAALLDLWEFAVSSSPYVPSPNSLGFMKHHHRDALRIAYESQGKLSERQQDILERIYSEKTK